MATESMQVRRYTSSDVPLWRLYTLRFSYFVLAAGIGTYFWPSVLQHTAQFAAESGIRISLLAGLGLLAVLGFRYPVKMLPLLLFELTWKAIYLIAFALPLWRTHQMSEPVWDATQQVLWVVIFLPLIPWKYVWRAFVAERGERWK